MKIEELQGRSFGRYDLPHLGALCRHIREARGIDAAQLTSWCHYDSSTTVRDFEERNILGQKNFDRYLAFLQEERLTRMPLSPAQADILRALYQDRGLAALKQRHAEVACIGFWDISPHNAHRPAALGELVDRLAQESQPALIMDDLWFMHALNEAQLRLYDIKPTSPLMRQWYGWHTIGCKIPVDSEVRRAHDETGHFLPPTIVFFFQHEHIQRHLFTLQVRRLLCRLLQLSEQHSYELHQWWEQLLSFTLPYNTGAIPRSVTINGVTILTNPTIRDVLTVTDRTGYAVQYSLVVWEVLASSNPELQEKRSARQTPQRIHYAAEYDTAKRFHVNSWPEVEPHILAWTQ